MEDFDTSLNINIYHELATLLVMDACKISMNNDDADNN